VRQKKRKALVDRGEKRDSDVVENKGTCASRWTGVPYRNFLTTWESDLLKWGNFGLPSRGSIAP
jgi:hypothetical protein